jgi:hypothetical protein
MRVYVCMYVFMHVCAYICMQAPLVSAEWLNVLLGRVLEDEHEDFNSKNRGSSHEPLNT